MSVQDDINISDEEFDAFLKGEGEFALMLRQLPQTEPSAQLDDAILAAAKTALATSPEASATAIVQPAQQAANDPVMPGKTKSKSSITSRWRIPLGLVASLFVTVQLVRMEVYDERMKPGAPALLVEKEPAPAEMPRQVEPKMEAPPAVAVRIVPPPGYEPPQGISAKPVAPAPATTAAIEMAQAAAAAASQSQAKKKLSRAPELEEQRKVAPTMTPPPPPPPVAATAAPATAPTMQYAPAPRATPAPADYGYGARFSPSEPQTPTLYGVPDTTPAPASDSPIGGLRVPPASARAVAPVTAVAPRANAAPQSIPVPKPAPEDAVAAPDSAIKMAQPVQRVEINGSVIRRTDKETASPVQVITSEDVKQSGTSASEADLQLAKIASLLKSGSTLEALAEWRKFRRAYPDYKVPEELRVKMAALLNQQTLDSGR
jgi:hypothetical protein